jgi:hypothetical protein
MKITKRQLRRIIREAVRYSAVEKGMASSYQAGYRQGINGEPPKKTRDLEYLRGYEKGSLELDAHIGDQGPGPTPEEEAEDEIRIARQRPWEHN